ncbi:LpxL/LpxP family acyltransferase [Bizionia myxarmorum]|uniref:Lipid A biosynthesis acyltransferase n=1 Tax=Bizionia myxarmorum TaxID=291186 RepID=A0A5D0RCY2_9FLAO|nr:lipid A biosynthesis acyltransferase [Bizionia myxarmorum]TYB78578.1 lipid A biosynthesis acyltransferase [Bizionia myxarmorum]
MATEWHGKSRGTVLGYKIFVFSMKHLGMSAAYFVLYFVAAYFCIFAKDSSKAIYYYFNKRLNYSSFKSYLSIYKSYYVFGQTLLDKIAISSNLSDKFTYEFDGGETITETLNEKKGGILISGHVGNFEISEYFFNQLTDRASISLLTTDVEHTAIKNYLETVRKKSNVKLIIIREDFSHIFEVNSALARNEIVCITGDRYTKDTKFLTETLLGETAKFPAGPFMLASRLDVPVLFVYVMKETKKHYHLYARRSQSKHRDAQGILKEFTESVTWMLQLYPLQWFNYFNFWDSKNG